MHDNENFKIKLMQKDEVECIIISGYLDAHTAPNLEDNIRNTLDKGKNKILVNFSKLDYISSAGLGVFMAFIEEIRNGGGDIKMSGMKPKVYSVFELLGFPMLFDITGTDDEALAKFKDTINLNNDSESK